MIHDPVKLRTPSITRIDVFFWSLRLLEYAIVCVHVNTWLVELERNHAAKWLQYLLGLFIHGPLGFSCMVAFWLGLLGVVVSIAGEDFE